MNDTQIPTDTTLKTSRLVLRYPRLDDAAHILAVVTSPQFPEQLPLKEMSELSQIEGWLTRLQEAWAARRAYSWIAEEAHIGSLVGQVTLSLKEAPHLWALAYWTHPGQWDKKAIPPSRAARAGIRLRPAGGANDLGRRRPVEHRLLPRAGKARYAPSGGYPRGLLFER